MNFYRVLCLILVVQFFPTVAAARDTLHTLEIADVMGNPGYAQQLQGVKFFFGTQPYPTVQQHFGEFRTNKKTNAFNKSDEEACQWVMLSALLQLHDRALELGANAVINIRSNYKNQPVSSETQYTCGAGNVVSGVALIGEIARIE